MTKDDFTVMTSTLNSKQLHKKLMTFDLRFDTLSEYLSNFAQVINHHATLLNGMHEDSKKKATKMELAKSLKQPADTFDIIDPEFDQQVRLQLTQVRPTHISDSLEDRVRASSNNLANKMDKSKTAFSLLFNQNLDLFERLRVAENQIRILHDTKADTIYVQEKVDRLLNEMHDKTDLVQKVV